MHAPSGGLHGGLQSPPIVGLDGVVAVGDGEALKAGAAGPNHENGVEVELVHAGQLKARQGAAWTFKIFVNSTFRGYFYEYKCKAINVFSKKQIFKRLRTNRYNKINRKSGFQHK